MKTAELFETLQTVGVAVENVTSKFDEAEAVSGTGPRFDKRLLVGWLNAIVFAGRRKVVLTCGAASQPRPPDWSAFIVQFPALMKTAELFETLQTDGVAVENVTSKFDEAEAVSGTGPRLDN